MESVVKYIFEAGMLKLVKRSGWWAEKIKDPESVADHTFRAAIIGFLLAKMEGKTDEEAKKICAAIVFHDMHETRLLDLNKITAKYIDSKNIGKKIERDQVSNMPAEIKKSILAVFDLDDHGEKILHDADSLECAFTAKEYYEIGYAGTKSWIKNIEKRLSTKSAKTIINKMKKMNSNSWWKGLKKLD